MTKTALRWVVLGKELAELGGAVGTPATYIRTKENLVSDPGYYIPKPILRRAYSINQSVKYLVQGSIGEFDARPDTIGELIYMILGAKTTTNPEGDAQVHVFKPFDGDLPHYTIFCGAEIVTKVLQGCFASRLTFRFGQTLDALQILANIVGGSAPTGDVNFGTYQPEDTVFSTDAMFTFDQLVDFEIDSGDRLAYLFDGEVTIENVLPIDKMRKGGSKYIQTFRRGDRKITGKLSLAFDNVTTRNRFLAGTAFSLMFNWEGATISGAYKKALKIELHNCKFLRDVSPHVAPIDEPFILNGPFQAFYDASEANEGAITLTNTVAAY